MAQFQRKLKVTWTGLKALSDKKRVSFHSYETSNAHEVFIIEEGSPSFWCVIWKEDTEPGYSSDDLTDWTDNYQASANGPTQPRDYDGRTKMQPVTLGSGQWHYWHGEGDNVVSDPQTVGGGTPFEATRATAGDETVEWVYRDPVWIAGGSLKFLTAEMGDHVTFVIFSPATGITPSAGGNTGNCNLHESGILIPAAGDGAYDVDLAAANPIPTSDFAPYSGFWDYALPADMKGRGTVTPGTPGQSKYHLIPADVALDQFVHKERLLGNGETFYEPQNINVSLCLPGWKFKCTLHNENGTHTVEAVWRVLVSRYWTTL